MSGFVSLVGAGPGDPELLTLQGRAPARRGRPGALRRARLAGDARPRAPARSAFPSASAPDGRPCAQETIHRLMIRAARRGKRVVRLKCGDPFVLGRGGEEALALAAAGIAFEVVPGLTHGGRGARACPGSPSRTAVSPRASRWCRDTPRRPIAPSSSRVAPGSLTLVILMGLASRAAVARLLISRGWSPRTPAAIVPGARAPTGAHTWIGTLDALATAPVSTGPDAPGTHRRSATSCHGRRGHRGRALSPPAQRWPGQAV